MFGVSFTFWDKNTILGTTPLILFDVIYFLVIPFIVWINKS